MQFTIGTCTLYLLLFLTLFCSVLGSRNDSAIIDLHDIGHITGFKVESSEVKRYGEEDDIIEFRAQIFSDAEVKIRLFGCNLKNNSMLSFTTMRGKKDEDCTELRSTDVFSLSLSGNSATSATAVINLPIRANIHFEVYYFCLKELPSPKLLTNSSIDLRQIYIFRHQGSDEWLQIISIERPTKSHILPFWLQIISVICLLIFSGLFSGLNLGLMALDVTELDILINSGTKQEKKYARAILPLRKKGNFLLCTILLGNVLVNNTLTILLDDLTGSGLVAILGSTVSIVVFGEIIPQAICSRYGLMIGAKTIWFTKFFTILTFPLSYPISMILDCILGKEIGYVFNRDRLRELIRVTEDKIDLERDELKIISGALDLSKKTIADVMTRIDDVYMIEENSLLNFETLNQIIRSGYSRIPVYSGSRHNIVAILNVRDLAFVDPDDCTPLKTIISFYKHPLHFCSVDTRLDVILHEFKKGNSHISIVHKTKPNRHCTNNGDSKTNASQNNHHKKLSKAEDLRAKLICKCKQRRNRNNSNNSNNSESPSNASTISNHVNTNINNNNNNIHDINNNDNNKNSNNNQIEITITEADDITPENEKPDIVGIVTLEDVIEEILQSEIVDEFDMISDNRAKSPVKKRTTFDFSLLHKSSKHNLLSPQMALAAFRFLSTSVSAFHPDIISENVLQRLLKENVVKILNLKSSACHYLYQLNCPTDHFIMLLEGRVEVEFGKDKVTFEGGPFVYFGVQAILGPLCEKCSQKPRLECILDANHYYNEKSSDPQCLADYTVKAVTDLKYICIKRTHYILAVHASLKERRKNSSPGRSQLETVSCDGDTNSSVSQLAWPSNNHDGNSFTKNREYRSRSNVSRDTNSNRNYSIHHKNDLNINNINANDHNNENNDKNINKINSTSAINKKHRHKMPDNNNKDEFGSRSSLPERSELLSDLPSSILPSFNFGKRSSLHSLKGPIIVNSSLRAKNKIRKFKNPLAHLWT